MAWRPVPSYELQVQNAWLIQESLLKRDRNSLSELHLTRCRNTISARNDRSTTDFPGPFRRRLRDLELDEAAVQHFVSQPLGTLSLEFKTIFSSLPFSTPMAILRTWSNGWFTTTRMHESVVLPCIFGCDANNSLHHYLRCEVLWTLIYSCTKCKYVFRSHLMRKLAFAMFLVRIAWGCLLRSQHIILCGSCIPTSFQMQFSQGISNSF